MEVRKLTLSTWEDVLPRSHEVFHRPEALSVLADYTPGSDLHLYGGFKGEETRALVPLFVRELPFGGRVVSSPPPGMHVPHLGPLVMPTSPKQRKRERVNQTFVDGVMTELGVDSRTFLYVLCRPEYDDPRPFEWADLSVDVSFTYDLVVGDDDPETVLRTFSKSRRREIRNGRDLDVVIEQGDLEDARAIFEQTAARFSEQNEYFGLSWGFVRDLYQALGDSARAYVARAPDGEFLSGIITLYASDTASFWLGGVRTDYENTSMNTLLHWAIVRDIAVDPALESIERYDMVGAGERRLSKYKAKFNPSLRRYYVVNSGGTKMWMAKTAYTTLGSVRSRRLGIGSLF